VTLTAICVCFVFQVELKFPAPSKTGNYQYSVILRSDSYLGLDQIKPLKVTFGEKKTQQLSSDPCTCTKPYMSIYCHIEEATAKTPPEATKNVTSQDLTRIRLRVCVCVMNERIHKIYVGFAFPDLCF